jgi:hypothetical protein
MSERSRSGTQNFFCKKFSLYSRPVHGSRTTNHVTEQRTCARCQQALPVETFDRFKSGNYRQTCNPCRSAATRKTASSSYETYLSNLFSKSRDTSKRRDLGNYEVTLEQLIELWEAQNGRCAVSGVVLTHHVDGSGHKDFNASIDRIDSQLGYVPGNIQLVALRVNILKQTLSTDMLYWWVKTIHAHSCD